MIRVFLSKFILLISLPSIAADKLSNELSLVENWLEAQRSYDQVPGLSATIVHDQDLIWSGASGFADLNDQRPASADTIYRICSISKLFTGIAVMQLRDQGKVQLDDAVASMRPRHTVRPEHKIQRLKYDMGGAISPRCLQFIAHPAVSGH